LCGLQPHHTRASEELQELLLLVEELAEDIIAADEVISNDFIA